MPGPPQDSRGPLLILARAVTYSTLFVGLLLVAVPSRLLEWSGISRPSVIGPIEVASTVVALLGAVLAAWCILTFVFAGKGTPAPFDPPRRLVVSGPYRFVRNPMYLGAGLVLLGVAGLYRSSVLCGYAVLFLLAAHIFVMLYEEPTGARQFGEEYKAYRAKVRRWIPRIR